MKTIRALVPRPVKSSLRQLYSTVYTALPQPQRPPEKYDSELAFWISRYEIDSGNFQNAHFRTEMLAMAQEENDEFLHGKVVADFGCGPRGSLVWVESAALRVGIDVLADRYADLFTDSITSRGMVYVKSTENVIPVPSVFVDVLFTRNAMDHVNNFELMCNEILRVLKSGGEIIGSFNIEEPPTICEPQRLTEVRIKNHLLNYMDITSYRIARAGPENAPYKNLLANNLVYEHGQRGYLWVRARKKPSIPNL